MTTAGSTSDRIRGLVALLCFSLSACGGGSQPPTEPPPEPSGEIATVEVTPSSATADAIDATVHFEATARDAAGDEVPGTSFAWSSSNPDAATVEGDGTATARADGVTTISAEARGVTGDATLTVDQEVESVTVTPSSVTLDEGEAQQFQAETEDRNGHPVADASLGWTSSDTAVATVDSTGLATARQQGEVTISAEAEGVSDSAELAVRAAPSGPLQRSFAGPDGDHHPPDLELAAGPDRLVAVSNGDVAVFSKSGRRLDASRASRFLAKVRVEGEGAADPRAVYDPNSGRFFVTAFGRNKPCDVYAGECRAHLFLAVSRTSRPSSLSESDWHHYALLVSPDSVDYSVRAPDFPRIGVTETAVVIIGQMVHLDVEKEFQGTFQRLWTLDKSRLLDGDSVRWRHLDRIRDGEKTSANIVPAKLSLRSPNLLMVTLNPMTCAVRVWALKDPLSSPSVDRAGVASSALGSTFHCGDKIHAAQPGSAPPLETGGRAAMNSEHVFRSGSLWITHPVEVRTGSGGYLGIRWAELSVSGWPGSPGVVQSSVISEEGSHLYYPAIAANEAGDAAIVYGQSSDTEHAATYVRARRASAPPDSMGAPVLLREGEASLTTGEMLDGAIRYGDYFGASLDPDGGSAWVIGEYVKAPDTWASQIGNVAF